jgi:hypothetical protein
MRPIVFRVNDNLSVSPETITDELVNQFIELYYIEKEEGGGIVYPFITQFINELKHTITPTKHVRVENNVYKQPIMVGGTCSSCNKQKGGVDDTTLKTIIKHAIWSLLDEPEYMGISDDRRALYMIILRTGKSTRKCICKLTADINHEITKTSGYGYMVELKTYIELNKSDNDTVRKNVVNLKYGKSPLKTPTLSHTFKLNNVDITIDYNEWASANKKIWEKSTGSKLNIKTLNYIMVVTEYLPEYITFAKILKNQNISLEMKRECFMNIMNVVKLANTTHGFVHGDLHAGNVFVNRRTKKPKLFDFDFSTIKIDGKYVQSDSQYHFDNSSKYTESYYTKKFQDTDGFLFDFGRLYFNLLFEGNSNNMFTKTELNTLNANIIIDCGLEKFNDINCYIGWIQKTRYETILDIIHTTQSSSLETIPEQDNTVAITNIVNTINNDVIHTVIDKYFSV